MRVFVSYSHQQLDWVRHDLVAALEAGGADVLIDHTQFKAGLSVIGQMDRVQNEAERHVLCISEAYISSNACMHELRRAIATDPKFEKGSVLTLRLDDAPLPVEIASQLPLWIDFRNPKLPEPWRLLIDGCAASLEVNVPAWLEAREAIAAELKLGTSINFVVLGQSISGERLLKSVHKCRQPDLALIDLTNPATISRDGFCVCVLQSLGLNITSIARKPKDLADFATQIQSLGSARVALLNFDMLVKRRDYDQDFYGTLRWLVGERALQLLIHSRRPFASLVPDFFAIPPLNLKTVELR